MSLQISFNDDPNLTMYCIIFEGENPIAFASGVQTFSAFSTAVYEDYCFLMPPVSNRPNYYRSIDFSTIPNMMVDRYLHVEVYQMVGSTFDDEADILKGVQEFLYNKSTKLNDYRVPRITESEYVGYYAPFNTVRATKTFYNEYGSAAALTPSGLHYQVLNPSGLSVATGTWTTSAGDYPYYNMSFAVSGNGFGVGNYRIISSGLYSRNLLQSVDYFTVATGFALPNIGLSDIDTVGKFGYATGLINDGSALDDSFITTLPSATDNFYNGQILVFTESPNSGQGRIISDYDGATKRITLNKSLGFTPLNNAKISVFPIGGELNVV